MIGKRGRSGRTWCSNKATERAVGDVQYCEFPRLQAKDRKEGEAHDEESNGGKIETAEDQQSIPATYCRQTSARVRGVRSSSKSLEWLAVRVMKDACFMPLQSHGVGRRNSHPKLLRLAVRGTSYAMMSRIACEGRRALVDLSS